MTKTAFVTGATGFVGGVLATRLTSQGWRVVALRRGDNGATTSPDIDWRLGDVLDPASLQAAIPRDCTVFHVAGDTNLWRRHNARQWRVNVEGTSNVVEAALRKNAEAFVHTSTISAYGRHTGPINEDTPSVAAQSWIGYERSKWAAEEVVRAAVPRGLRAMIIAPSAILGPGDRRTWAQLIIQVSEGRVPGIPPGKATFNHIDDVVQAHIAAAEHGRAGRSYLLSGDTASFAQLLALIAKNLGVPLTAPAMPAPLMVGAGTLFAMAAALTNREPSLTPEMATMVSADTITNSTRATSELGYQPRSLEIAVADACAWLSAAGLLGNKIAQSA